jgi:hypothetical protein
MFRSAPALLAPLLLAGCISYNIRSDGTAQAALAQTVQVGSVQVTPLAVVEDSRCPALVRCVWAGRLRLSTRIGRQTAVLKLGEPAAVGGGTLTLTDARPLPRPNEPVPPEDYRFRFRFN